MDYEYRILSIIFRFSVIMIGVICLVSAINDSEDRVSEKQIRRKLILGVLMECGVIVEIFFRNLNEWFFFKTSCITLLTSFLLAAATLNNVSPYDYDLHGYHYVENKNPTADKCLMVSIASIISIILSLIYVSYCYSR